MIIHNCLIEASIQSCMYKMNINTCIYLHSNLQICVFVFIIIEFIQFSIAPNRSSLCNFDNHFSYPEQIKHN